MQWHCAEAAGYGKSPLKSSAVALRAMADRHPSSPLSCIATGDARISPLSSPLIFHIPHAGIAIPEPFRSTYLLDEAALEDELLKLTDWFTDELFTDPKLPLPAVTFPYSRLLVDVERFTDDAQEPMAEKGMGVFYTRTTTGAPLRPRPTGEAADQLLRYYEAHQTMVAHSVDAALARCGQAVVIDCHSFPESALPCHDYASPSDIAFCIGTDPDHTPPWLTDWLVEALKSDLGKVAVNTPFAGSYVPARHDQQDTRVHSIMIEVNRALYMDEATGAKTPQFPAVQKHLRSVFRQLAEQLAAAQRLDPNQTDITIKDTTSKLKLRLGKGERENCASKYADQPIHLELNDGTTVVAKWFFIRSADAGAVIIEPTHLAGTQLIAPHIPGFGMLAGRWYYKDDAITEKAYNCMKEAAEDTLKLWNNCQKHREQLLEFHATARQKSTCPSGEIDRNQLKYILTRRFDQSGIDPKNLSLNGLENVITWLKENRI